MIYSQNIIKFVKICQERFIIMILARLKNKDCNMGIQIRRLNFSKNVQILNWNVKLIERES